MTCTTGAVAPTGTFPSALLSCEPLRLWQHRRSRQGRRQMLTRMTAGAAITNTRRHSSTRDTPCEWRGSHSSSWRRYTHGRPLNAPASFHQCVAGSLAEATEGSRGSTGSTWRAQWRGRAGRAQSSQPRTRTCCNSGRQCCARAPRSSAGWRTPQSSKRRSGQAAPSRRSEETRVA